MNTTPTPFTPIGPTVHMNGTGGQDLLDQYCDAMRALSEAMDKLPHPNGRDYYVQAPGVIQDAMRQRERWAKALQTIHDEIELVADEISHQVTARIAARHALSRAA